MTVAALVVAACGGEPDGADSSTATTPSRPHVVIYMIDTLRADRLGCYGYERDTSPAIDALAAGSVRVEHAVTQAPWTLPSCVSLQTSTYPQNHGVVSGTHRAPREAELLVEFMDGLGYHTAGFIQNRLGGSMAGLDQGYEVLFERPTGRGLSADERARGAHTLEPFHEWITSQDGSEPLFVYIHTSEPHHPYEGTFDGGRRFMPVTGAKQAALNKLLGQHRGLLGAHDLNTDAEKRAEFTGLAARLLDDMPALDALYDGDVRRADENVRDVIAALRRQGLWDDTVFVLVSDHGEEFFEHRNWFHDQSLHGELTRVPMILRIPGLTDHGRPLPGPGGLIDIAPTIADVLDEEPPAQWLGRSLVPDLEALAAGAELAEEASFAQRINVDRALKTLKRTVGDRETALVSGRWKAILRHDVDDLVLYDVVADPGETRDLSDVETELAAEFRDRIEAFVGTQYHVRLPPPLDMGADDPETVEALRQLGYVDEGRPAQPQTDLDDVLDLRSDARKTDGPSTDDDGR